MRAPDVQYQDASGRLRFAPDSLASDFLFGTHEEIVNAGTASGIQGSFFRRLERQRGYGSAFHCRGPGDGQRLRSTATSPCPRTPAGGTSDSRSSLAW